MNFYNGLVELLTANEDIVVVTLYDQSGSAPRTAGAKMIVKQDGSILGTIGGGRLEATAITRSRELFITKRSVVYTFDLTGTDIAAMDMICGGKGEVLLDYIAANAVNLAIYSEVSAAIKTRQKAWLITALSEITRQQPFRQQCLVKHDGTIIGNFQCEPNFRYKLKTGPAKISIHTQVIEGQLYLIEAIRPSSTVYIFGAGHVAQKIAPLTEMVGFRTVVADDRMEYANKQKFTAQTEIMLIDSFAKLPSLPIDRDSYVVIVTRGHLHDQTVLEQVLRTPAAYIGMIGSRKKRDAIYSNLVKAGFSMEELSLVHSPIGLAILAETPEEIAVSIVGELIKVRAERENDPK